MNMAIYDIFEHVEKCMGQDDRVISRQTGSPIYSGMTLNGNNENPENKSRFFSSFAARLFFFMLLIADLFWGVYATVLFVFSLTLNLIFLFRCSFLRRFYSRRYLAMKRVFVCAIALFVALFCPALGTMFACSYFLMYDKKGVEEVVPSVLQDQFREFFTP